MPAHFKRCESDADYARFALYFIRNRHDFNDRFSLPEALAHMLSSLPDSHIVLIDDEAGAMIGWGHYRYIDANGERDPQGETVFVESVIVDAAHRSTRTFLRGFRHLAARIASENSRVRLFRFRAEADNVYLNRLYSKFARRIGEEEGFHGREWVYSTAFDELLRYLGLWTRDN